MTFCDLPSYLMLVRASALASNSGSYNSTAHAPACIQAVKLGGACNGSQLSPARKLLKLSFAGSWFIPYGKSVALGDVPYRGSYFTESRLRDKRLVRLIPECRRALFPFLVALFGVLNE